MAGRGLADSRVYAQVVRAEAGMASLLSALDEAAAPGQPPAAYRPGGLFEGGERSAMTEG